MSGRLRRQRPEVTPVRVKLYEKGKAFSTLSRRPLERHDVPPGLALAMPRPYIHQLAPSRERVRSAVGLFGLVADNVR